MSEPVRGGRASEIAVRALSVARFFVLAGVFSGVLLAIGLYLQTMIRAGYALWDAFIETDKDPTKSLLVLAVEQADVMLVATALLITGFGLYALFIGRVSNLPAWLQIESIDELKSKLIGVVIAALGVNFFSSALHGKLAADLLSEGLGTAAVIFALGYFLHNAQH